MRIGVWIAVAGILGCKSDYQPIKSHPVLSLTPESVDFGEAVAGVDVFTRDLEIQNVGQAVLEIDLTAPADPAFTFTGAPHLELAVDESAVVTVAFAPTAIQSYADALGLATNDPDAEQVDVALTGVGRIPKVPDIEITPGELVWAEPPEAGTAQTQYLKVANVGEADLVLGSITQSGAGSFAMVTDPSGSIIAPGEFLPLGVLFTPYQLDGDSGALTIPSNDPDEGLPGVAVSLTAGSGGTFDYPVAVFDCQEALDLLGSAVVPLDGTASYDPLGFPLTYAWSLVRRPLAADEARQVEPPDQAVASLLVDAAGTWEVNLVVTNSVGAQSAPTKCVIDAVPTDAIHVELSWGGATSDMDLHLAEGDAPFYDVPGDVSWCNPGPDWGAAGVTDDDGHLLLDDADGFGPEQVGVYLPADGTYPVRVHFFDDGSDGTTTANVSVFLNATLVFSGSKVLARNEVWDVGTVNWPQATFGISSDPVWDAEGTRECIE